MHLHHDTRPGLWHAVFGFGAGFGARARGLASSVRSLHAAWLHCRRCCVARLMLLDSSLDACSCSSPRWHAIMAKGSPTTCCCIVASTLHSGGKRPHTNMLPQLLFPFPAHEHAACNWPRWARGFAIAHFQAGTETLARRSRGAQDAFETLARHTDRTAESGCFRLM